MVLSRSSDECVTASGRTYLVVAPYHLLEQVVLEDDRSGFMIPTPQFLRSFSTVVKASWILKCGFILEP